MIKKQFAQYLESFFNINCVFGAPRALGPLPSDSSCPAMYISSLEQPWRNPWGQFIIKKPFLECPKLGIEVGAEVGVGVGVEVGSKVGVPFESGGKGWKSHRKTHVFWPSGSKSEHSREWRRRPSKNIVKHMLSSHMLDIWGVLGWSGTKFL